MTTTTLKETPLVDAHRALGGRMVDFAGWNMPVQYKSIVTEHMATRTAVGLFDVSHMGEFLIEGEKAGEFLQHLVPNDVLKLTANKALYTQLAREDGTTVDDLIIYRQDKPGRPTYYMAVVNASNIDKDWKWFNHVAQKFDGVKLTNVSDHYGLLALQGPKAVEMFAEIAGPEVKELGSFHYGEATIDGTTIGFGRTGYTGEDGFEIFVSAAKTGWLWQLLLERGAKYGIEPCGLGARDTLRLEAGLPLYGHELTDDISPVEAGLEWSVKFKKADFLGRDVLLKQKEGGLKKRIVCLKADGKALPRQDYDVYKGDKLVGKVTSGSQGIFVGYPIAFALVEPDCMEIGKELAIDIRGKHVPAHVVERPFYKREK
jgi:aminomethyltransferase